MTFLFPVELVARIATGTWKRKYGKEIAYHVGYRPRGPCLESGPETGGGKGLVSLHQVYAKFPKRYRDVVSPVLLRLSCCVQRQVCCQICEYTSYKTMEQLVVREEQQMQPSGSSDRYWFSYWFKSSLTMNCSSQKIIVILLAVVSVKISWLT